MNIPRLIFIGVLLISINTQAQKRNQELLLFGYNIGFGVSSVAISSLLNKSSKTKTINCITNAIWQSAIGSSLQFCGKKLVYQIPRQNNFWWGWSSKFVHSIGSSINYNASLNYPFGKHWFFDYGPIRVDFHRENSFRITPRFNVGFIYDIADCLLTKGKLDISKSIQTGSVTFVAHNSNWHGNTLLHSYYYSTYYDDYDIHEITAHELVHIYQVHEYRIFNNYSKMLFKSNSKLLNYFYFELPYLYLAYLTQFNKKHYYKNLYEFEAKFFSTNSYVDRSQIIVL